MKTLLFGAGLNAKKFLDTFADVRNNLAGFVVSDNIDAPSEIEGFPVYHLEDLLNIEFDEIDIVNQYYNTVEQIIDAGIPKSKIVLGYIGLVEEYYQRHQTIDLKFRLADVLTSKNTDPDVNLGDSIIKVGENELVFNSDYCRMGTLKLLAREINQNKIQGNVAELGVYKGDFARYINKEFPDKNLYLFDTFDGFDDKQNQENIDSGFTSKDAMSYIDLSDTSVNEVMKKMEHPENVVIRKGLFPDTKPEEELNYAFVSIDCDIYQPIYDGISYFYPRLNKGGYIMIHDYNNEKWGGKAGCS